MSRFDVIQGVEGCCLALDDTRIAGPKPWGGGTIIYTWETDKEYIESMTRCTHAYETYQEIHGTDCPAWECGHCGELFENGGKYCTQCEYKITAVLPPKERL